MQLQTTINSIDLPIFDFSNPLFVAELAKADINLKEVDDSDMVEQLFEEAMVSVFEDLPYVILFEEKTTSSFFDRMLDSRIEFDITIDLQTVFDIHRDVCTTRKQKFHNWLCANEIGGLTSNGEILSIDEFLCDLQGEEFEFAMSTFIMFLVSECTEFELDARRIDFIMDAGDRKLMMESK